MQERVNRIVANDPALDFTKRPFMTRTERFTAAVATAHRMMQLKRELKLSEDEFDDLRESIGEVLPYAARRWPRRARRRQRVATRERSRLAVQSAGP